MLAADVSAIPFHRTKIAKYFICVDGFWKPAKQTAPGAQVVKFEDLDPKKIMLPAITLV